MLTVLLGFAALTVDVGAMYNARAQLQRSADSAALAAMSNECLTPGGLNEQVLRECRELGWFQTIAQRLDNIAVRINR